MPKAISQRASIKSAKLELKIAGVQQLLPGNKSILYPVTKSWNEDEVTYGVAKKETPWDYKIKGLWGSEIIGGGDIDKDFRVTSTDHLLKDTWVEFDVTAILKEMVASPDKYDGFLVAEGLVKNGDDISDGGEHEYDTSGSYNNPRYYYSSEFETKESRPKLTIDYDGDAVINNAMQKTQKFSVIADNSSLRFTNDTKEQLALRLYDLKGRTVKEFDMISAGESFRASTAGLAQGVYTLRAVGSNAQIVKQVVID